MTDIYPFLRPPLLPKAVAITASLESIIGENRFDRYRRRNPLRFLDINPEQHKNLLALLEHILQKPIKKAFPTTDQSQEICFQISNFWIQEFAQYILAKNQMVHWTYILRNYPRIPESTRIHLRCIQHYLDDRNIMINPQSPAMRNLILIDEEADCLDADLSSIARQTLPHVPGTLISWENKIKFAAYAEILMNLPLLQGVSVEEIQKASFLPATYTST